QPLHFGDYGGLPLKALWAALDVITIVVLASGLYLWLARGRNGHAGAQAGGNGAGSRNGARAMDRPADGTEPASASAAAPARASANGFAHGHAATGPRAWDTWRAPVAVALVTLVGLIAALVGDGWPDGLSWAALAVPVALAAWGWG